MLYSCYRMLRTIANWF